MRYIFERFEFDDRNDRLSCDDVPLPARPKLIALLRLLIRQRGRVVSRQELLNRLWPDIRVGGTSLSTLLNEARSLLGDAGDRQHMIRTEPGRGYSFIAPVEVRPDAAPERRVEGGPTEPMWLGDTWVHNYFDLALEDLPRGGARHLLIRGEPGSGKSHLIRDLLQMTAQRGITCFKTLCPRPPEDLPLAPWLELLSSIRDPNRMRDTRPFGSPGSRPWTSDTPAAGAPQVEEDETALPAASSRAVGSVCQRMRGWAAERGPTLILIEGLHRADRASLLALERLMLGLTHEPLLLVASLRPTDETGSPWRQTLLERIQDLHSTDTIELARLGRESVSHAPTRPSRVKFQLALQSTLRTGRSAIRKGDLEKALSCLETALEICDGAPDRSDHHPACPR